MLCRVISLWTTASSGDSTEAGLQPTRWNGFPPTAISKLVEDASND